MPKKHKTKKPSLKKAITATALTATIITSSAGWYISSSKNQIQIPYYEVERVLDGDTFVTKEAQKAGYTKGADCFNQTFPPKTQQN